jgi:AcrR family transcriptional regulator
MSELTRSQLLETGRQLFAQQGFEGARVDRIARLAGVNKALINYHFRGKGGLYRSVLGELFKEMGEALEETLAAQDDPGGRLLLWPEALSGALDRVPEFAPTFLRELAAGCSSLPPEGMKEMGRGFALLAQTLSVGRKQGVVARAEPFPLGLLLFGALLLAEVSGPLRQSLEGTLSRDQLAGSRRAVVPLLRRLIEQGLLTRDSRGTPEAGG